MYLKYRTLTPYFKDLPQEMDATTSYAEGTINTSAPDCSLTSQNNLSELVDSTPANKRICKSRRMLPCGVNSFFIDAMNWITNKTFDISSNEVSLYCNRNY